MIVVIIAGGSGTRLWPLSTPSHPKHLLKINGDEFSLVQHTYNRAKQLTDSIYVATEAGHVDLIKEHLTDLPDEAFIVEPARRGTANCIIASLVKVGLNHPETEPVIFMHADHYIRDTAGFVNSFNVAVDTSEKQGRMVLIGIEPDYASTGYGYIQKGELLENSSFVYNVAGFKEKPDHETANEYLHSGNYLWNGGYFVGTTQVFTKTMQQHSPELYENYQKLKSASSNGIDEIYMGFENIAIDYALIEKVPDLLVVPASFDWMDLGSFSDLHKAVGGDEQGNHITGKVELDQVQNSFIANHEDKPVAIIGVDNIAVVNTPKGVLIVRKDLAQNVGDIGKRIEEKR